ncbi:S16 family serine protease, partial [Anaplasma bovis]|uniref:S16 family serine protease n=1 Tax=Anaplasma bovis TaxID=186733 RepID=UPI002FEF49F3
IRLSGYMEEEKFHIARNHLIPALLQEHGLRSKEFEISDGAIYDVIRYYTRESGVRSLKRELASLMRKCVKQLVTDKDVGRVTIGTDDVVKYLGAQKYDIGVKEENSMVGAVTGLAYTDTGGELLTIEAVFTNGKGEVKCTGKLGEVMQESVKAAYSYVMSKYADFSIKSGGFKAQDVHVHVPEGATPKDGPSAGIAICVAIISLVTGMPVKNTVAMTGEITLRGRVLPIGGLKEKLLAAMRGGISTVLIPSKNKKDIDELPDSVKKCMEIVLVSNMDEVVTHALVGEIVPSVEIVKQQISSAGSVGESDVLCSSYGGLQN